MRRAVVVLMMVLVVLVKGKGETRMSRMMYDSMSQLVGEPGYPDTWWEEREQCLTSISPRLTDSLEQAWLGMIQYWEMGGLEPQWWLKARNAVVAPASRLGRKCGEMMTNCLLTS